MELSISPYKALLVVGILVGGLYLRANWNASKLAPGGGGGPTALPMPEPLRKLQSDVQEVLPKLPGAKPGDEVWPASPGPTSTRSTPSDAPPAPATEKKPPRVFTPDEKARSAIALADGYAENGLFDKAYQKLEEAETLDVSAPVKQELATAKDRVTTLMRSRRR